jgi:antirestriction protein ArdC
MALQRSGVRSPSAPPFKKKTHFYLRLASGGYRSQRWLTFRQALGAGGCGRKGEKGTAVCHADRLTPKGEQEWASDEAKRLNSTSGV